MPVLSKCVFAMNIFTEDVTRRCPQIEGNKLRQIISKTKVVVRNYFIVLGGDKVKYITLSFSIDVDGPDDKVYGDPKSGENFIDAIPRSYHIFCWQDGDQFKPFVCMHGIRKQKVGTHDDDDDHANMTQKDAGKNNKNLQGLSVANPETMAKLEEAFKNGCLGTGYSLKDNGKFTQYKLTWVRHSGTNFLMFLYSSKGVPGMCLFDTIGKNPHEMTGTTFDSALEILNKILIQYSDPQEKDRLLDYYKTYPALGLQEHEEDADKIYQLSADIPSTGAELSDGQHIVGLTNPDNLDKTIIFGSVIDGNAISAIASDLEKYNGFGLRTVPHESIIEPSPGQQNHRFSSVKQLLEYMTNQMICCEFEGGVYHLDIYESLLKLTSSISIKVKSSLYKLLRSLRQIISNQGWWPKGGMPNVLTNLFSERHKANYNKLNTAGVFRFIQFACSFCVWAMKKRLPVDVVRCVNIDSLAGKIEGHGMWNWVQKFCDETDTPNFSVREEDIGKLDVRSLKKLIAQTYPTRNLSNPVAGVFLVGLIASGKSSLWNLIENKLRVSGKKVDHSEQDEFHTCRLAPRSWLRYLVSLPEDHPDSVDIVGIPRMNLNEEHYSAYFEICRQYNVQITIAGPSFLNMIGGYALAQAAVYGLSCCAHVKKRSMCGDKLIVSRQEMTLIKAINLIQKYAKDFRAHQKMVFIDHHKCGDDLTIGELSLEECMVYWVGKNVDKDASGEWADRRAQNTLRFVEDNYDKLLALDRPQEDIADEYIRLILEPQIVHKEKSEVAFTSAHITQAGTDSLRKKFYEIFTEDDSEKGMHNAQHHITVRFCSKNCKIEESDNLEPGEKGIVTQVTHAVQRISDGQIAWRVGSVVKSDGSDLKIASEKPHLTELVAWDSTAGQSGNFVMLNDETVKVIELETPIVVDCVGIWM